jgi:hypothetical protein
MSQKGSGDMPHGLIMMRNELFPEQKEKNEMPGNEGEIRQKKYNEEGVEIKLTPRRFWVGLSLLLLLLMIGILLGKYCM